MKGLTQESSWTRRQSGAVATRQLARRNELLSAAATLFAKRGFTAVTMDDIGAAAGITGPALYHHFDTKEALVGEMLVKISESLLSQARDIVRLPDEDALLALIGIHAEFAVDNRPLITVHFRELVHANDADQRQVRALQNAYVDIWVEVLTRTRRGIDARTARAATHAVLGLINSTPFSGRLRRDTTVALLRDMAEGSLSKICRPAEMVGSLRQADHDPDGTEPRAGQC